MSDTWVLFGGYILQTVISRLIKRLYVSVVVEKPFVNSSSEADRCIALAKQQGKILTIFQSVSNYLIMLLQLNEFAQS